jgi:GNAT superfamily N-acetyltransferase
MAESQVRITTFKPEYAHDFTQLNCEWIETHFVLEQTDREQLGRPRETILDRGGEIFFILEDEHVIATCAMIPHGEGFELAKMAVSPRVRGRGFGDLLMKTAVNWAKEKGAKNVMLLSNTVLEPAIQLYRKHGFETVKLGPNPDYDRANIEMVLKLR